MKILKRRDGATDNVVCAKTMMKKLKPLIALTLALIMMLSLAACGKKQEEPAQPEPTEEPQEVEAITEDEPEENPDATDPNIESMGDAEDISADTLMGHYEVIHMSGSKNDVSDEDLALMKSLGLVVTLDIYSEDNVLLTVFDEEMQMTYDLKNRLMMMDDKECSFKFATDELTIYEGESTMTFKKVSNTPGPMPYNQAERLSDMYGKYIADENYTDGDVLEIKENGDIFITRDGKDLDVKINMDDLTFTIITVDEEGDETETKYSFMFYQDNILLQLLGDENAPQIVFSPFNKKLAAKAAKEAAGEDGEEVEGEDGEVVEGEDGEVIEGEDGEAVENEDADVEEAVDESADWPEKPEGGIRIIYKATKGGTVTIPYEDVDIAGGRKKATGATAKADEGYKFQGWQDETGKVVNSHSFYQPNIGQHPEDMTFTAVFANANGEVEE